MRPDLTSNGWGDRVPSLTLLAQSVLSGLFVGGLYGLLGLGLSLSWGFLRLINLAHFALAFLGAYLTYTLSTAFGLDPSGASCWCRPPSSGSAS